MTAYVMDEDTLALLETVQDLASLQAWIFEEIEIQTKPGGRGLPGVEISALGKAMHHLLGNALAGAKRRFDVEAEAGAEVAHG